MGGGNRQIQLAAAPVGARTYEPIPAPADIRLSSRGEVHLVVDIERLAGLIVGDRIPQTQPAPGVPGSRFKFDDKVVVVEFEAQIAFFDALASLKSRLIVA
jgi:hypothetical protein